MSIWKTTGKAIHNFLFGKKQKPLRNMVFLWIGIIYVFLTNYYIHEIYTFAKKITPRGDFYISYFNGLVAFIFLIGFISVFKYRIINFIIYLYNKVFYIFRFHLYSKDEYLKQFAFKLVTIFQLYIATFVAFKIIKKGVINGVFINSITDKIITILTVVLIVYFTSGTSRIMIERQFQVSLENNSDNASILRFMNRVIYIIIWIVGSAYLLSVFGYNPMTLLAGAGIGGIAIAFGAQKSIANIFGAITILLNKPFAIEDFVEISGIKGTVKDIGLTYVRLLDRDGKQVMIPNETIITTDIKNFSQTEKRLVEFELGVDLDTPIEKLEILVEKISTILGKYAASGDIASDYRANFNSIGVYSFNIKVFFYSLIISIKEHSALIQEINISIKNIIDELDINISAPGATQVAAGNKKEINKLSASINQSA